jgi:hypothetical protein
MIRLRVKGKPEVALAAAKRRGVEVSVAKSVSGGIETLLGADDRYWRQVVAWMNEHKRAPYPAGALLYFNAIDPMLQGRP